MQAQLEHELIRVAQAFRLHFADSFSFVGGPIINAAERIQYYSQSDETSDADALTVVLRRVIYYQCFVRKFDGTIAGADAEATTANESEDDFVAELSKANRSRSRWDPLWRIYRVGVEGDIQAQKGDLHQFAVPGEFAFNAGPGVRAGVGDVVNLQVAPESLVFQPGYYFCFGEELSDRFDDFDQVRFYFNIEPHDAPPLLEFLSRELNRFQIPFRFKCPTSPANYYRIDTAVLYVSARWFQMTRQLVGQLAAEVLPNLQPDVSLFCRRMWPGIGFAEDPGNDRSFGEHRCNLVARGICRAWQKSPEPSGDDFLRAIELEFQAAGISLKYPWLNAGSVDIYGLPEFDSRPEELEVRL